MVISKVTLNGKSGDVSVAQGWIRALNDPRIVQEKAGFLFKASLDGDHLMLAAAPCLINGERLHHYDQHLEKEDAFTLLGVVNATGVFTILIKPDTREQVSACRETFLNVFRQFAGFMLDQGYAGEGRLDEVTQSVLISFGSNPPSTTLSELASL